MVVLAGIRIAIISHLYQIASNVISGYAVQGRHVLVGKPLYKVIHLDPVEL